MKEEIVQKEEILLHSRKDGIFPYRKNAMLRRIMKVCEREFGEQPGAEVLVSVVRPGLDLLIGSSSFPDVYTTICF